MVLGGKIQNLVLFDYGLLDKICDKIKKMVLQMVLSIILERSKLIHIILSILKILTFHDVIILFKSIVDRNKNKYYYNMFLQKGLYNYKSNKQYF